MESADTSPAGTDGARDVEGRFKDTDSEGVEGGNGGIVEFTVGGEREEGEDYSEDSGETGEDLNPVGKVCAETGRVGRVESSACE